MAHHDLDFITILHNFVNQFESILELSEWSNHMGSDRGYMDFKRHDWDNQEEHLMIDYKMKCIIYRRDPPPTVDDEDQGSYLGPLLQIWDIRDYEHVIPALFTVSKE